MPRQKAPEGYITATEVKKILNISSAMVANYVEKGRIKYIVPPGRTHGFYLKKDVDKLASEINTFFNLEEETTVHNNIANRTTTTNEQTTLTHQRENTDEHLYVIEQHLENMKREMDQHFSTIESMLTQILKRLP